MSKAYQAVTDQILALLDQGVVPWRRPWTIKGNGPTNISSGKSYRGFNFFMLGLTAHVRGYCSNIWGTYKQIKAAGGQVRKGEKSTACTWYSPVPKKQNGQPVMRDGEPVCIPVAKLFRVFNLCQCDGLEHLSEAPGEARHTIFDSMPTRPEVHLGGEEAFYRPSDDSVTMPHLSRFDGEASYWSVMFHELVHSTGRKSRLVKSVFDVHYGGEAYSEEELVAAACDIARNLARGLSVITLRQNSAPKLLHWITRLHTLPVWARTGVGHDLWAAYIASLGKDGGGS